MRPGRLIRGRGLTENDGHENDGPSKLQDMKLQDTNLQDIKTQGMTYIAGHKNARLEIAGQIINRDYITMQFFVVIF